LVVQASKVRPGILPTLSGYPIIAKGRDDRGTLADTGMSGPPAWLGENSIFAA
jgi:hypothetical protein